MGSDGRVRWRGAPSVWVLTFLLGDHPRERATSRNTHTDRVDCRGVAAYDPPWRCPYPCSINRASTPRVRRQAEQRRAERWALRLVKGATSADFKWGKTGPRVNST